MKKKDLKTGMLVKYRNGQIRLVLFGTEHGNILSGNNGWNDSWNDLNMYNEYLIDINGDFEFDIIEINQPMASKIGRMEWDDSNTIWRREEKVTCKDDLRDGDFLILRNGDILTLKESITRCFGQDNHFLNKDLTNKGPLGNDFDIMEVERNGKVVFERKEESVIEMTVAQIAEKLNIRNLKIIK